MPTPQGDQKPVLALQTTRGKLAALLGRLPRLEYLLVTFAFLGNLLGKVRVLSGWTTQHWSESLAMVLPSDVAFFAGLLAVLVLGHALLPAWLSTRLGILLGVLACAWSVANSSWLTATGVQIHVGIFRNLVNVPEEFGQIVINRLLGAPRTAVPLLALVAACSGVVLWHLVRPRPVRGSRRVHALAGTITAALSIVALSVSIWVNRSVAVRPRLAALAYSSHGFALSSLIGRDGTALPDQDARSLPREGQRTIAPPTKDERPHVVFIVLESTGLWATSLGGAGPEQTPTLARLAAQGTSFANARAVITHTTQSQFSLLTGANPDLEGGFVEAVMVEPPYESLATILRTRGYRSIFAQMVRARYECNPGLVHNLGFDFFWAREDYGDPSANLGYLAGDDFKMIPPAFEWMGRQDAPCLMFLMTSVAHHPYEVPKWYSENPPSPLEAYLQSVRYTDAFVQAVIEELSARQLLDNTLLCVIADHGEGLGRHDILCHNENPYEEALKIPWILSWPGHVEPGRVIDQPCSIPDVTPTILSVLGFDVSRAGFDGVNALEPRERPRRLPFAGWHPTFPAGVVEGDDKIIYWPSLDEAYRYRLSDDPDERAPVRLPEQEKIRIRQELAEWRSRCRITFAAKRYRERFLFNRWQTFCLGDTAWCFYAPPKEAASP